MQYMLIMRVTQEAVDAVAELDVSEIVAAMGRYNESLVEAGVLAAGEGLSDASEGFVVDFDHDPPRVVDGAYGERPQRFDGFWILEVSSKEEAAEWAMRCPLGPGATLEVRRVTDASDFDPDDEWIQKEAGWRADAERRAAEQG